jgi:Zn-dependent protease with chaperone function
MHDETSKCDCIVCGNHIEFPVSAAETEVSCPHCGETTRLVLPATDGAEQGLSANEVLAGFTGPITSAPVSFFYQLGLLLTAATMGILPIVYLAMIGCAGFGVYYYATHASFLVESARGGFQIIMLGLIAYLTPLFTGGVMVFFMIKPLFARRPRHAQPLALNPAVERTLFTFIAKISELVGAPMPTRIDLDCHLNASARFRRGGASALSKADLALTIGLPLVAGLNARELAGVIAHEFGHFTQSSGMRLSYFVRSINAWFARVVYERDAWDVSLEEAHANCRDWRLSLVFACARLGVWSSRLVLKALMLSGHGVCCFLLRQMEYDADSCEIKAAGSAAFETAMLKFHVLQVATAAAYKEMRVGWNNARILADDFPQYLIHHEAKLPAIKQEAIKDSAGLLQTRIFDAHPSAGDRIRKARQANEPGVIALDFPASALFANFGVISRQVTLLHYTDDLRIPAAAMKLRPLAMANLGAETAVAKNAPAKSRVIPMRVKLGSGEAPEPPS